ncbi:MAG: ABC transporter ATP-binding protein [Ktedonobacterales bacterium]|nr:ABC transporter ATP-binding protein [Ktedonobacterales bacterium]
MAKTLAALAFEQVGFAYAREPVIEDVTLAVAPGAMVGLLGPNGAGKSTLLGLAAATLKPLTGRVLLHGAESRRLSRRALARMVAVVPQAFSVQFAYTTRQLVEMGRAPHRGILGTFGSDDREAVAAALAATNTTALADRVFNELSGGERQRVIVALALAQAPSVLLLDEPTAHLDIKHQIEMLELLRRLNTERGLTVIAALHDLNLAARYFPRLVLFHRRVVADGPPARVLDGALLSRVYGTPVRVGILRGEEHLSVLPPGYTGRDEAADTDAHATVARAHILAGGGSGELLMRTLADAGIPFSAGPLNVGDSDCALARRLAAQCIEEPPYAPVSAQGLAAARERMRMAGAVMLCPMPLGSGNVSLLEAALAALADGALVIVLEPGMALAGDDAHERDVTVADARARDFSGRGPALYHALAAAGARWVASPAEAVALLALAPPPSVTPRA